MPGCSRWAMGGDEFFMVKEEELVGQDFQGQALGGVKVGRGFHRFLLAAEAGEPNDQRTPLGLLRGDDQNRNLAGLGVDGLQVGRVLLGDDGG